MKSNSATCIRSVRSCLVVSCLVVFGGASVSTVFAQSFAQPEVSIETPKPPPVVGRFLRPFHFEKRIVPAPKLVNTPRLEQLVRGGNLYLTFRT